VLGCPAEQVQSNVATFNMDPLAAERKAAKTRAPLPVGPSDSDLLKGPFNSDDSSGPCKRGWTLKVGKPLEGKMQGDMCRSPNGNRSGAPNGCFKCAQFGFCQKGAKSLVCKASDKRRPGRVSPLESLPSHL